MRKKIALGLAMTMLSTLGCGGDPTMSGAGTGEVPTASFKVRGSVEQIHVWKAKPATKIEVRDGIGNVVASGMTDTLGSLIFRHVLPGDDYAVSAPDLIPMEVQRPVHVMSVPGSAPRDDFYKNQKLSAG